MVGMPGAPGTRLPAVSWPMGSRWRDALRTEAHTGPPSADPTSKCPGIPGSLRTPPRGSWARGLKRFLGTA